MRLGSFIKSEMNDSPEKEVLLNNSIDNIN